MKIKTLMVCALSTCAVLDVLAMPTEKEARKAESAVKKMMAPEQAALRSRKKTRAEVAVAAMNLAAEANSEAEKLLLMKGAFSFYVKDGDYENAAQTMMTLESTISDVPPKSVTNMIETAFRGLPKKNKMRLYQLLDEAQSAARKKSVRSAAVARTRARRMVGASTRAASQIASKYPNLQTNIVDGVSWLYVDAGRTVSLVGAASPLPQNLVMPSEINGKRIMTIEEKAFERCEEIVTLETPDAVMSIGKNAFAECPNLESVRIMSGSVRWRVFNGCPKLTSVFVGKKVQSLEYASLADCERLSSIDFEEGSVRLQLQDPFEGDCALASLHLPARYDGGPDSWCHGSFGGCENLRELTITDGNRYCRAEKGLVLSADGKTLMSVASGLATIDIPPSVETIASSAIKGCGKLREIVIPDTVKTLCTLSIQGCPMLESVTIGAGIENINLKLSGCWLMSGCPRLTTIRFLGNAPAYVDSQIYKTSSPALITYVTKGTTGWNPEGGDDLPTLWPTNGVYGRKIAYWGDKTVKPFEPEGPYGIHMQPQPGCEDGADYVLGKLATVYLPRAVRYYGDPFNGKKPSRIYTITVRRNNKGMSYGPGTGGWSIGLAKDRDTYEFSLDYLASSVLTVCEDANWASFVFYVNKFVEGDAKGQDPVPELKRDIEKGLSKDGGEGNSWYRAHAPLWAALEELRENHPDFILKYCKLKNQRFAEGKLPAKLSALQMAKLMGEVTGENAVEIFARYGLCSEENAKPSKSATMSSSKKQNVKTSRSSELNDADTGNSKKSISRNNINASKAKTRGKDIATGKEIKKSAVIGGYTWSYSVRNGEATIVSPTGKLYERAVSPKPEGVVTIPSMLDGIPVTGIGKSALYECPKITSIVIPPSVTTIGEWAFCHCEKLSSVTVPSRVTSIGECAFSSCPLLTQIGLAAGNAKYKVVDGVMYTKDMKCLVTCPGGMESVTIPAGVKDIGDNSFRCCRILKSVKIPKGVQRIGDDAFCATAIESLVIPPTVESIGNSAFWCCDELTSLTMSEGLSKIGRMAFYQCGGLTSVTIPASVEEIGYGAFEDCESLTDVTMLGARPNQGDQIFDKCNKLSRIHVSPKAQGWSGLKSWQNIPIVFDAK